MSILIGSTGFVGTHLARGHKFTTSVHRTDVSTIDGARTDLLVCAGLPAEKWRVNADPDSDWHNMCNLAQTLTKVTADRAILISTIDVYQPAVAVNESDPPNFKGESAYGTHRGWFEYFFRTSFPGSMIVRLPGLYAEDLRKNLVYDLMRARHDQLLHVNPASYFQFFDVTLIWDVIKQATASDISILNVSSEPVRAQEIADLFGVSLAGSGSPTRYDMRTKHAHQFGREGDYIFDRSAVLSGIKSLRNAATK